MVTEIFDLGIGFLILIIVLAIWEIVWKAIGMWTAAKNNQKGWFIAIFLLNTVGILPILYIYLFQKKIKNNK